MSNTNPIHSVQNTFELFADPVHFPITIGNDNFVITQQDQRNILDRRTWYLTHIPNQLPPPQQPPLPRNDLPQLPQLLQHLANILSQLQTGDGALPPAPFRFHYEKQTSTEDLAYHLRRIGLPLEPTTLVKHVHFVMDRTSRDKGTGMADAATLSPAENRMVCESHEGNAEVAGGSSQEAVGGALDRIRRAKEAGSEFW